jgi:flagellar motor switch protein FliN/FliY
MNAIPPKPLAPDPKAGRAGETEGVRLTIDFDEDLPPEDEFARRPRGAPTAQDGHDPLHDLDPPEAPLPAEEPPSGRARAAPSGARPEPGRTGGRVPAHLAAIEVTLSVEIGCHQIPLRDLLSVEPGQLVPLDRMTAEPVSVLVNGKPFARGEVVAIGERYGVRLLEILEPGQG